MDELDHDDGSWQLRKINKAKRTRVMAESEEKWNVVVRVVEPGVKIR